MSTSVQSSLQGTHLGQSIAFVPAFGGPGHPAVFIGVGDVDGGEVHWNAGIYLLEEKPAADIAVSDLTPVTGMESASGYIGAVSAIGDADGDGFDEVFYVAAGLGTSTADMIFGPNPTADVAFRVTNEDVRFAAAGSAGDIDTDGYADFWLITNTSTLADSAIRVFSGGSGREPHDVDTPLAVVSGPETFWSLQSGTAVVGDVNGDAVPDLVVSSPEGDNTISIFAGPLPPESAWSEATTVITDDASGGIGSALTFASAPSSGQPTLLSAQAWQNREETGGLVAITLPLAAGTLSISEIGVGLQSWFGALGGLTVLGADDNGTDDVAFVENDNGTGAIEVTTDFAVPDANRFLYGPSGAYLMSIAGGDLDGDGCTELFVGSAYDDPDAVYILP